MMTFGILASGNPLDHVVAHDLFRLGPVVVNNHMFMATVVFVLMLIVFPLVFRKPQTVPSGFRNLFESICVYFRDEVARPVLHDQTDRYIGLIWTTFFFILFSNILGMFPIAPIVYVISGETLKDYGGTATGNIYVTGALAVMIFLVIHAAGIQQNIIHEHHRTHSWAKASVRGFIRYWYLLVPPIGGVLGVILFPLFFVLEFLSVVTRCFALALRLFANMLAGHTVLATMLFFIALTKTFMVGFFVTVLSIAGSVMISCLELFVAFLQAYIFTLLATFFIGMSVHQEH
jgi:F-type H+-transporting ATPase subunit a